MKTIIATVLLLFIAAGSCLARYANFDRVTKKCEVRGCGRTRMAKYATDDMHLNKSAQLFKITQVDLIPFSRENAKRFYSPGHF